MGMNPWAALALLHGLWAVIFALWWWRCQRRRDATSVDLLWTIGVATGSLLLLATGPGDLLIRGVAAALLLLWGLRLSWHLAARLGHGEDGRYADWRQRLGERAPRWFFGFFQLQAVAVTLFCLPAVLLATAQAAPWAALGGGALALVGLLLGARADTQVAAWRADPANAGRTCRAGLWAWCRHPNYFAEWLYWLGLAVIAAPAAPWLAAIQPIALYFLLRHVTGIPPNEARARATRGDDYRRYQQEVPAFWPWPPKPHSPRTAPEGTP
jgi:steroid 5-alpha reductase family enzyme